MYFTYLVCTVQYSTLPLLIKQKQFLNLNSTCLYNSDDVFVQHVMVQNFRIFFVILIKLSNRARHEAPSSIPTIPPKSPAADSQS